MDRFLSMAAYSSFSKITATMICSKMSVLTTTKESQKKEYMNPSEYIVSLMSMCQFSPVSACVSVIRAFHKEAKLTSGVIAPYFPSVMWPKKFIPSNANTNSTTKERNSTNAKLFMELMRVVKII